MIDHRCDGAGDTLVASILALLVQDLESLKKIVEYSSGGRVDAEK